MNKIDFFNNIKSYKYLANKSLGQNFLINCDVAEEIVNSVDIHNGDNVLEIGAGLGSLSYFLIDKEVNATLIDVDENMVNALNDKFLIYKNIVIKRQNILKFDVSKYERIIGNLPYYITSGIIEYLLLNAKSAKQITLMVQKEVFTKLNDKKEISPLSLLLNYVASFSLGGYVSRNNFAPAPHVDSAYFIIKPNSKIMEDNLYLYKLMCRLFLYRRKTLSNSLSSLLNSKDLAIECLKEAEILETLRPEQIDIQKYISLLNVLKSKVDITKIM